MGNTICKPKPRWTNLKQFLCRKFGKLLGKGKIDELVKLALDEKNIDKFTRMKLQPLTATELADYYEKRDALVGEFDDGVIEAELLTLGMRSPPEFTGSDYASSRSDVTSMMMSSIDTDHEDYTHEETVSIRTSSNFERDADVCETGKARFINVKPHVQSISAKQSHVNRTQFRKKCAGDMKTEEAAFEAEFEKSVEDAYTKARISPRAEYGIRFSVINDTLIVHEQVMEGDGRRSNSKLDTAKYAAKRHSKLGMLQPGCRERAVTPTRLTTKQRWVTKDTLKTKGRFDALKKSKNENQCS